MLTSLQIENIAIIERASVGFSAGLNVLTGETGAGKSIIIDSINAVSGEKTSRELIRTGEASACVTALFEDVPDFVIALAAENGIDCSDHTLLLQRRLYKDGKNACRINGMTVTLSMLKLIAMSLVNIQGQRDSQTLLDSEHHMSFVDSYAENELERREYADAYAELCRIKADIKALNTDEAYKARRIDLLTYQLREIGDADIRVGEKKELEHKRTIIENSLKLIKALSEAMECLTGDGERDGASGLIASAAGHINGVTSIAKELSSVSELLMGAKETVEDAAGVIDDVLRQLDSLDVDINTIEERLDVIYRLSKKYGATEEEILAFAEDAQKELDNITFAEERLEKLNAELTEAQELTVRTAEALTRSRAAAGKKLADAVEEQLRYLDMPHVRFLTEISAVPFGENGADDVCFLITANPGEAPKPLGKVASGGELSRIMLAVKNVLTARNGASTLIFDEIDSGVSGSAASKIAVKLAGLASASQVICITHQAQIAAYADRHLFLSKEVEDGRTYTHVAELEGESRARELARITFGENYTETQLSSSAQLIDDAQKKKKNPIL